MLFQGIWLVYKKNLILFISKYLHQVVADYADIFDQPVHTGMSHSWINNLSLVTLKNKGGGG